MVNHFRFLFIILITLIYLSPAYAAKISAFVDRTDIRVNESFTMTFESDGSVDDDPDFKPLQVYFDILNQSQGSNMTIINGKVTRKSSWKLSLMAKRAGQFTIPEIEFGRDRSSAISITVAADTVNAPTKDSNLILEAEVSNKSVYVQSQIIYTLRLFRAVNLQNASLSEPRLNDADALVINLGEDKNYQTTRKNKRYLVTERRYSIFPQQSGKMVIAPVVFTGQIVSRSQSFFSPNPSNVKTKRLYTKEIALEVKPIPAIYKHTHWLPARDLQVSEQWSKETEFNVGDPITRTITIKAFDLTASTLPEITLDDINGIKQYPDQPIKKDQAKGSGITGTRQEKIALIPTQAGDYQLPEIVIPWWNTKSNRVEIARLPARKITVTGESVPLSSLETNTPTHDVNGDSKTISTVEVNKSTQTSTTNSLWFIVSIALLIVWLLTLLVWFLSRRPKKIKTKKDNEDIHINLRKARSNLKSACNSADADLCKKALLDWAHCIWPTERLNNIGQICQRVNPTLAEQIDRLNKALYDSTDSNWQPDSLYEILVSFERDNNQQTSENKNNALPSLYKVQT